MSEYPKMIYAEDGSTHVLPSAEADRPEGNWSDHPPADFHHKQSDHFVTINPDPEDASAERIARHLFRMMEERFAPTTAGDDDAEDPAGTSSPRRGRPPGSRNRNSLTGDDTNGE